MTTKDIHVIVVGASWYGDWAQDVFTTLKDMGVSADIVYTNSLSNAAGGDVRSFKGKIFSFGKTVVRKTSSRLFERLKQSRAKAAEEEVINRVAAYTDKSKQLIAFFIWTPPGPTVLKKLRDSGVRCIIWQGEPASNNERWLPAFDHFEHLFIIEEGYLKSFPSSVLDRVSILPLATSSRVHFPLKEPIPEYISDVGFIGLYRYGRADILSVLQEFDLKIYGHGWEEGFESFPWLKGVYKGPLSAEQTNMVFNSAKISIGRLALGFTEETGQTTNQRVFDIACANAFELSQIAPSTAEFFGDAVVMFDSKQKLRDQVQYYLAHPEERRRLAQKAHDIVIKEHTYNVRIREVFRVLDIALS